MEERRFDYGKTSIKWLRIMSIVLIVLFSFSGLLLIFKYVNEEEYIWLIYAVLSILFGVLNFFFLQAFAIIAENAFWQKTKIKYELTEEQIEEIEE